MNSARLRTALIGLSACVLGTFRVHAAEIASPLEPHAALAHFQLDPGLTIELVACEPQVIDPIAIRFDEDGRLCVVEMRDYPHGPPEGKPPLSKIRVLTDRDADGHYETSQLFAEELLFPTGLQPWKGGVIVTLAGEVIYLKDTDGDGRADLRETWFRGFAAENPQLRANHPRFGLDNRIYVANGLRGGTIVDPRRQPATPLSISGRDFCFDPHTGACEAVSGNGQFGLAIDDFGNRFVCNNREPLDHVVLENRDLARNPFLAVPGVVQLVAPAGEQSKVFPLTRAWTTSNLHAGQFTAACGVEIFRGDALGDAYLGNAFTCEPTGSLVHREVFSPAGATFASKPAVEGREFLASPDSWFRPVNLEVGPDGALYVVDMYRAVIEHPEFMPTELQKRPDMRKGDDRGRIYRIVRKGAKPPARRAELSKASTPELVALLEHKNAWWRETAARLLYERQETAAKTSLEQLIDKSSEPLARTRALWALAGQGAISEEAIARAIADPNARVREQGVVLAESKIAGSSRLREAVFALAADDDPRVRFRVALAIGGLESPDVGPPLARIAMQDVGDDWTRRAVATSLPKHLAPLLLTTLNTKEIASARYGTPELRLVRELATIVGSRREANDIGPVLNVLCGESAAGSAAHEIALAGLAEGLARRGGGLVEFVATLADHGPLESGLNTLFEQATVDALDEKLPDDVRAAKLELLQHARSARVAGACLKLVNDSPLQSVRVQAASALARQSGEEFAAALVESYPRQTPAVRRAILDALLIGPAAAGKLLEAVRSGHIARAELDTPRENRLRQHGDPAVQSLAKTILTTTVPAERRAVLADYQQVLALESDAARGKESFRQHCAACHHIGDVGVDVAPDISDSRSKTPQQLLTDILHPNQAIDNNYVSYAIATSDGNVHTGIIASETSGSITLRQAENKTLSLLRADIEAIRSSGVSLMPEGFEKHLSHQQMSDLIAFIKNWRYLAEAVPGTIGSAGKE